MNVGQSEAVYMANDWPFPVIGGGQGFNFDTLDWNTGTAFYNMSTGHFVPNVAGRWKVRIQAWMQADGVQASCNCGHGVQIRKNGVIVAEGVDDMLLSVGSQPCAGPQTERSIYLNGTGDYVSFSAWFDTDEGYGPLTGAKMLGGYTHTYAEFVFLG